MTKLYDRIEEFRKARPPFSGRALSVGYESGKNTALPIIRDLQADNKRLRDALGEIEKGKGMVGRADLEYIARAALKGAETSD